MGWLVPVLYALSVFAMVLAWGIARCHAEHRPIAYLLTLGLVADLARHALTVRIIQPWISRFAEAPLTGWARVAAHLDDALFLAWSAGLAATALWVFLKRRPWPVLGAYLAALLVLILGYPTLRGGLLARAYTAAHLAAVLASLGCAITWWGRRGQEQTTAHVSMMLILSVELTSLTGAYREGLFGAWYFSQIAYVILYGVLVLLQGGLLWRSWSSSDSP